MTKSLASYKEDQREAELAEARIEPNPFGIRPRGNCPVQAEGKLSKSEHYYFRARHESWSLTIASTHSNAVGVDYDFYVCSKWGEEHEAGYMRKAIAIRLITQAIQLYLQSKLTAGGNK